MVKDIFKLTFKKPENFINKYIYLNEYDELYLNDDFASYLCDSNLSNKENGVYHTNGLYIIFSKSSIYCSLYIIKTTPTKGLERFKYKIGGFENSDNIKEVIKLIINKYLNSKFARLEKIKKIINRVKNE